MNEYLTTCLLSKDANFATAADSFAAARGRHLGLLALPDGPTPYLAGCALHTALAIEAGWPDGTRRSGVATVEEVAHGETTVRGLLLDLGLVRELPVGSPVWLAGPAPAAG